MQKEIFVEKAGLKFNNKFEYIIADEVVLDGNIRIVCPEHGEFQIKAKYHLNSKYGCPKCGATQRTIKTSRRNSSSKIDWNIRLTTLKSLYQNKYVFPVTFDGGLKDKVPVVCPLHGTFYTRLFVLLKNKPTYQCQICRNLSTKYRQKEITKEDRSKSTKMNRKRANESRRTPFNEAVMKLKEKHGDRFRYFPENFTGTSGKITFRCQKHGVITANYQDHINSVHGCPKCAINNKSKAEQKWLETHNISNINYSIIAPDGRKFRVDGYDPINNTLYEFLGDYWHGHPSLFEKHNGVNARNKKAFVDLFNETEERFCILSNIGYNIIYAWESDVKRDTAYLRVFNGVLEYT